MVKKANAGGGRGAGGGVGQIGDMRATPALLSAAAGAGDRFVEHSIIYSLITLHQPEPLLKALRAPQAGVQKAALIALDQMEESPLTREDAVRFVSAKEKALRSAALFVVSHHADWAAGVLRQIELRIRDRNFVEAE